MRLCYIAASRTTIPSKEANAINVIKMAQAFVRNGLEVELLVRSGHREMSKEEAEKIDIWEFYGIKERFRIRRIPAVNFSEKFEVVSYGLIASLLSLLGKFDLYYTRDIWTLYFLTRLRKRVIFEAHMFEENSTSYQMLLEAAKGPFVPLFVVISQALGDLYKKEGVPAEKLLVAHDGVDITSFDRSNNSKEETRKKMGLPLEKKIALYLGHLKEERGINFLLETAKQLNDVLFLFIGGRSEEDKEEFRRKIEEDKLKNIKLIGFIPNADVPLYLSAADLLLMPYTCRTSTWQIMSPLKMFEYMAAARPIVASDMPVIREVLKDGKNAILVQPDSVEALVEGIKQALKDDSSNLAEQAYLDVQKYSWKNRAKMIMEKFASV